MNLQQTESTNFANQTKAKGLKKPLKFPTLFGHDYKIAISMGIIRNTQPPEQYTQQSSNIICYQVENNRILFDPKLNKKQKDIIFGSPVYLLSYI